MKGKLSEGAESEPVVLQEIPSITKLRCLDETRLEVSWEDAGAEAYWLYSANAAGEWVLTAETGEHSCVLADPADVEWVCVSAVYRAAEGSYETPRSAAEPVLLGSRITAVTQLDRYTAVIQYEETRNAGEYRIYRCETENGTYTLAGTSYETVYYDENADGKSYFYQVQPISDKMEGPVSPAVRVGTNGKKASGVAVFMYHEFVTQEDLDAGGF